MKRRAFLKAVAGGLSLPVIPTVSFGVSRYESLPQRILVIGAGGMGALAASALARYTDFPHRTIDYLGVDKDRASAVLKRKGFPVAIVPRQASASKAVMEKRLGGGSHSRCYSAVLLLAALGGGAGTRLADVIAAMARDLGVLTVATFGLPARLDDRAIALEKLPEFQQATHYSLTVDFADVMGRTGSSRPEFCQSSACIHALAERARQTLITLMGQLPASDSAAYLGLRALPS